MVRFVIVFATFMNNQPAPAIPPFLYLQPQVESANGQPQVESPALSQNPIYLDHNATSPLYQGAQKAILETLPNWGNPSSIHMGGRYPKSVLRETRKELSKHLSCDPLELIFNSGGSEGNSTVIHSVFQQVFQKDGRNKFITTMVEHPSVIQALRVIESLGAHVVFVPVQKNGHLDLEFLKKQIDEKTALVSVMTANNEFGSLFPIQHISQMAHQYGALMHTDAVQAFGKIPVDLKDLGVDYATFSGHKFYALKGTGVLFVKRGRPYQSLILGGGQERHRRAGTENIVGISSLKAVVPFLSEVRERGRFVRSLRDAFETAVLSRISDVRVNASESLRLPNTSSLIIEGIDGETLLMSLDMKGFAVSTGAACSSGNPEPSPSLLALGLRREEAQSSLRVSFGWGNTMNEVQSFVHVLSETVAYLRSLQLQPNKTKSVDKLSSMMEVSL